MNPGAVSYGGRRFADLGELRQWLFAYDDGHEDALQLEWDRNVFLELQVRRVQV